uniref:Uncharacterized protein n=1 Tax=Pithovirus LCPAC406 TaxID=2506599 RepID=A0A481ZGY0_9VIRU|nr:MAG: hypothetical protein LCPAC406_03540 [Pithovirus LCPAC406]
MIDRERYQVDSLQTVGIFVLVQSSRVSKLKLINGKSMIEIGKMDLSTGEKEFKELCQFMKDNDKVLREEIPQLFEIETQDRITSLCEKWKNTPSTLEDLFAVKNNHKYLHRPMGAMNDNHNCLSEQLLCKWTSYCKTAENFRLGIMMKMYKDQG